MCPWVAIAGLLVFVTDAAAARDVSGVEGYPVTLPCTYASASTSMCWGRGPCPNSQCSDVLIWTDGSKVTYQKAPRYVLQGKITQGNVSLTIKEATLADSGVYCCRIEHPGWFNDQRLTLSLKIKPAQPSSTQVTPRSETLTSPAPTATWSLLPKVTSLPSPVPQGEKLPSTPQETSPMPPTSSLPHSCPTDANDTAVTPTWDGAAHENQTLRSLAQNPWMTPSKRLGIGFSVVAVVVITFLVIPVVLVAKKHLFLRKKQQQQLSMMTLHGSNVTALQSAAAAQVRAEDNIYTVEDNPYVTD